jgi:S1-C subfamily serine protease
MFTRIIFAGLLLTVGFAGGLVLTGRLPSAAFSEARHVAPVPGTASETPAATPASEQTAARREAASGPAGAVGGPDFTEVAARTTGAVVNISSMQEVRRRNPLFNDPFFSQFFGDEGQYSTQRGISAGSGVIISPNGYVLTNNHVVGDNSTGVSVILADKREKRAKLIGVDPVTDLALLKIDGQNLPTIPWGDSSQLKVAK